MCAVVLWHLRGRVCAVHLRGVRSGVADGVAKDDGQQHQVCRRDPHPHTVGGGHAHPDPVWCGEHPHPQQDAGGGGLTDVHALPSSTSAPGAGDGESVPHAGSVTLPHPSPRDTVVHPRMPRWAVHVGQRVHPLPSRVHVLRHLLGRHVHVGLHCRPVHPRRARVPGGDVWGVRCSVTYAIRYPHGDAHPRFIPVAVAVKSADEQRDQIAGGHGCVVGDDWDGRGFLRCGCGSLTPPSPPPVSRTASKAAPTPSRSGTPASTPSKTQPPV